MKIQNADTLISHGSIKARRLGLDIAEEALASVDTYEATKKLITLQDGQILLPNRRISLTEISHIYVIGAGKASTTLEKGDMVFVGKALRAKVATEKGAKLIWCSVPPWEIASHFSG